MAANANPESPEMDKIALGKKMTGKFLGEEFYQKILSSMKDDIFSKTSMEYIWETCFSSYARPGLEFRERSLMNIAMLIALNRAPELRIHIRAAVHNGLTEEQICEACRHAMIYCGVPAGRDAMGIASDVFAQLRESGEYPK
ncbi:uncharacterized protein Z520_02409 [Fonsecaea multimorphosa CBS 102226]|uniref:Carboxymuconolactone decarboxylase-like domain-containing protein n=1 Tax=Fonsecaea multimorphosa CBS 102226 TaxID=1442371 RepID=A0A0D2HK43_9EURO|nr:uncharacterized protein Z520_02409 [Fonsecaea multimorphosa CBS 102226]KIY02271.1 hypothetical protein Z520_02409 [Fonsecaea multimorphosa CBS 102226]OAL28919.1 hypothetical protein AYO22_02355 [Fonsecaea multimorphosa]